MKRLLIGLTLFAAACAGGSPTTPSGSSASDGLAQSAGTPASSPAAPAVGGTTVDPVPVPGTATTPQFTLTGPRGPNNCITAGTDPLQWVLNVTDSGPSALRFVALAHQDDQPGCDATTRNPRTRVQLSGVTNYGPHTAGQTVMTFDQTLYNCGRVQVDVSIYDAQGHEILIVALVLNYGTTCRNIPVCIAPTPAAGGFFPTSTPVTFTASGGNGIYTWSAPAGTPASGTGPSFTTTRSTPGTVVATLTSGGESVNCSAPFNDGGFVTPFCQASPSNPVPQPGAPVSMSFAVANAGAGTYSWIVAPAGAVPASASGTSFTTTLPANLTGVPITYTITPSGPGIVPGVGPGPCQVVMPPALATPFCLAAPGNPVPQPGLPATLTFNVVNAQTGTYVWGVTPAGATPAAGTGTSFTTTLPANLGTTPVTYSVSPNGPGIGGAGGCQVVMPPPTATPSLTCAPPTQNVLLGQPVIFTGTVSNWPSSLPAPTLTWQAPNGSPASGTTSGVTGSFGTSYTSGTSHTVTVSTPVGSTGTTLTATCQVTHPAVTLTCTPPTQAALPGQLVSFVGTVSGLPSGAPAPVLTWAAAGGAPAAGTTTGTTGTFSTAFANPPGSVTVSSTLLGTNGAPLTATCQVTSLTRSCVGVTATITRPIVSPTAFVTVTVPTGQVADMRVDSLSGPGVPDLGVFTFTAPPGTTTHAVPVSCFPKVYVYCGGNGNVILDNVNGANTCTP